MITTLLVPALVLSIGGGHAVHHPANTNLYFEIPDVPAAVAAYPQAPLVRFFEDPEIQKFAALISGKEPEEFSLQAASRVLLKKVRESLPAVGVSVLEMILEVEQASVSLAGVDIRGLLPLIQGWSDSESEELRKRLGQIQINIVLDFSGEDPAEEGELLIRSQLLDVALDSIDKAPPVIDVSTGSGAPADLSEYDLTSDDFPLLVSVQRNGPSLAVRFGFNTESWAVGDLASSLADNPMYQRTGKHWQVDEGVTIINSYFSVTGIDELHELCALIPQCPERLPTALQMYLAASYPDGQFHMRLRSSLTQGQFISESFLHQAPGTQAHCLLGPEPITRESFSMVPSEAVGVWASNLNKGYIARALLDGMLLLTGTEEEVLLATLKEEYGFQPVRDLVMSLGGTATIYTMPYKSIGQPKVFMALDLVDPGAFTNGLEALGRYATDHGGGMVQVYAKPYRKHPFMVFSPGKRLLEDALAPMGVETPAFISLDLAVGVVADRVIISTSRIFTKREIKRLIRAKPEDRHAIMDQADDFPESAQSYGTTDWGSILAGAYGSVRGFLPLIVSAAGIELPFELEDMPSGKLFSRYIQPSTFWTRHTEGGTYSLAKSSFGPEIPFLIGSLVAGTILAPMALTVKPNEEVSAEPSGHEGSSSGKPPAPPADEPRSVDDPVQSDSNDESGGKNDL